MDKPPVLSHYGEYKGAKFPYKFAQSWVDCDVKLFKRGEDWVLSTQRKTARNPDEVVLTRRPRLMKSSSYGGGARRVSLEFEMQRPNSYIKFKDTEMDKQDQFYKKFLEIAEVNQKGPSVKPLNFYQSQNRQQFPSSTTASSKVMTPVKAGPVNNQETPTRLTDQMASAASTQQSLADVFECPVCLDSFKDPRVLPACGHTFCKECIEQVHDNGTVNCPTCRKVSGEVEKITQISDLAKAFIVNELQQRLFEETRKKSIIRFCACCSKKAEPAKHFCNLCRLCLCDSCEAQHQEGSLFAGHGTEPLDRVTFCKTHDSQQVSFHCHPCNEFICSGCAIGKHNGHAAVDINIEAANRRQTLEDMVYERSQQKKENKQKMKKANQYLQDKEQDLDDAEAEIRSIEKLANGLIKQLQSQREKIKSAQNANREVTDTFLFNIRQTNSDIRHEERKLSKLLSNDMTDCQLIEKFLKVRELDTDFTTEGEDMPVYTHVQAISADVRHALSTLMTAVPNLPVFGNPNAGPSSSMAASSSKRQTDQSSTHRKKRTKTAHPETDDEHGGFGKTHPMYRQSSPETTSMTLAHTSDCEVISPDHSLRTPGYTDTIPVNNSLSPTCSPMSPTYNSLPLYRYRPISQEFNLSSLDDRPRTPDYV